MTFLSGIHFPESEDAERLERAPTSQKNQEIVSAQNVPVGASSDKLVNVHKNYKLQHLEAVFRALVMLGAFSLQPARVFYKHIVSGN